MYNILAIELFQNPSLEPEIKKVWKHLTPAQKIVIENRMKGKTLQEVSTLFGKEGISREAVRQFQEAGLKKIRKLVIKNLKWQEE